MFEKTIEKLGDALVEVTTVLNERGHAPKAPKVFFLSTFTSVALSSNYAFPALVSLPLAVPVLMKRGLRKVLLVSVLFNGAVAAPLFFTSPSSAMDFLLRTTSSVSLFLFITSYVGWRGLILSIPLPEDFLFAMSTLPLHLYLALKDLNTLVLARRSRSFSSSLRSLWWALATATGSLIVKEISRAQRVSMALKARGMFIPPSRSWRPTVISLAILGVNALALLVQCQIQI